jgi:Carbon starvation protein CstA
VIALGAISLGIVALSRGETINAAWLVIAAVCVYFIAYRFYGLFIARTVLGINPAGRRPPPGLRPASTLREKRPSPRSGLWNAWRDFGLEAYE